MGHSLTQRVAMLSLFLHRIFVVLVNLFVAPTTPQTPLLGVCITPTWAFLGQEKSEVQISHLCFCSRMGRAQAQGIKALSESESSFSTYFLWGLRQF